MFLDLFKPASTCAAQKRNLCGFRIRQHVQADSWFQRTNSIGLPMKLKEFIAKTPEARYISAAWCSWLHCPIYIAFQDHYFLVICYNRLFSWSLFLVPKSVSKNPYIVYIYITISIWLVVRNMSFIFPYIGNNHPNWFSHFSEGLKPPTSYVPKQSCWVLKSRNSSFQHPCLFSIWWKQLGHSPIFHPIQNTIGSSGSPVLSDIYTRCPQRIAKLDYNPNN